MSTFACWYTLHRILSVQAVGKFNSYPTPRRDLCNLGMAQGEQKSNKYKKGRQQKRKVAKIRSRISELKSTKQQFISELATKSDNSKPTGGGNGLRAGTSFGGRYEKANKWQFWCTLLWRVMRNFSTILPNYASIVHEQQNNDHQIRFISPIRSSNRSISSTSRKPDHISEAFYVWA